MSLITGIISFLILNIGLMPYVDLFAYKKHSVLPHIILAIIVSYVNTKLGFNGFIENILFLVVFYYSVKNVQEVLKEEYPEINNNSGLTIVKRANNLFIITYLITYFILNIKLS